MQTSNLKLGIRRRKPQKPVGYSEITDCPIMQWNLY